MKKIVSGLHQFFIPAHYQENEQEFRKARIIINTTLITAVFALFFLFNTIAFDMPHPLLIMIGCAVLFTLNAFLIRWGVHKNWVTHFYVFIATLGSFGDCYYTGGLYSFNVVWFALGPVCAVLMGNTKMGWFWAVINTLVVLLIGGMQMSGYQFPMEVNPDYKDFMYLNSFLGLIWIVFIVMVVMENASVKALKSLHGKNIIIEEEKKRSDDLIQNILPLDIIEELKDTGQTVARSFDSVSVMFTDFVDFTNISTKLSPEELVAEIDFCYQKFDEIVVRNGLEKIKTIGDAYLAVCGLPHDDERHAHKTVRAATEIMQFIQDRLAKEGKFDIRIGIHSGPLVAGIVGIRKFAYDIWGDTVNTASRMESSSEPGKINISEVTYDLIKEEFDCMPRGQVEAKSKGMLEMFFVENI